MRHPKVVILSAGIGSRLGSPYPKALAPLGNDETIFSRQLRLLRNFGLSIIVVVGFKKDLIMEADPNVLYAYNTDFDTTNTSKSLYCGLQHIHTEDVLWINGDVVFEAEIIGRMLQQNGSLVVVNNSQVGEEEVKYTTDDTGFIQAISKQVDEPLGEALGINLIESRHLEAFKTNLQACDRQDYFERGMELLTQDIGPVFRPLSVDGAACVEVDFKEDLQRAKTLVSKIT
jgi:choline kinase